MEFVAYFIIIPIVCLLCWFLSRKLDSIRLVKYFELRGATIISKNIKSDKDGYARTYEVKYEDEDYKVHTIEAKTSLIIGVELREIADVHAIANKKSGYLSVDSLIKK